VTTARVGGAPAISDFRPDINGLRALSIALVIAYHLAPALAPGGFAGVDVFFVISGYLMTRIIQGGLEAGRFSLRGFYLARLRRIWPALAAFCAGLWVWGFLCLDPWTFQRVGQEVPFAASFLSNFVFLSHGGYFGDSADENWVLHTWSVAVEWQFYLVYPLVLLALARWRWGRRRWWMVAAGLAAASFALSVALPQRQWSLDFYMLPTRAWELLAGALVAAGETRLRAGPLARGALHLAGLALIGLGVIVARPNTGWPSFVTLAPVGGAAAVILARARSRWAEFRPVDFIGRASYSIYLWHWPVVVWLKTVADAPLTPAVAAGAVTVMVALGALSYWLVERRLTRWVFQPRRWRWALAAVLGLAAIPLGALAGATHGLEALRTLGAPDAVKAAMADARRADDDWAYPDVCSAVAATPVPLCRLGDPVARQVLVIGDSQAEQFAPRYAHAFDGRAGQGLTFTTIRGCVPIPGVSEDDRHDCGQQWARIYRYAETAGFARVVIVGAWDRYFDPTPNAPLGITRLDGAARRPATLAALAAADFAALAAEVRRLQAGGAQVVLMPMSPLAGDAAPRVLYAHVFWTHQLTLPPLSRAAIEADEALTRNLLAGVARDTAAPLVDPLDAVCQADACQVMEGPSSLYKDFGHYRASMMRLPLFAYLDPWLDPADSVR
jgi:peptidoglycan/LPS O-acetylase OafA/YrhL